MGIHITHVAVYTAELERMRAFYETYFGARSNELYRNADGFSSYFMTFDDGARLELMSHERLMQRDVIDRVNGMSHIAISVGSREAVENLTARLVKDGYRLNSPARTTGDGYFESSISDPDGNPVEITI